MTGPSESTDTRPVVIALDVGGTDIKAALMDADGVLHQQVSSTRAEQGAGAAVEAVLEAIASVRARVPRGRRIDAVGLAVPGTVDEARGVVASAENLGWTDLPLRSLVEEATELPVGFGHDVRAGGLAEWELGAGRGAPDHVYLSVGTGIAAALMLRGDVYSAGGWAGEVGHGGSTTGEACSCGGRGCAETYASAAGMAREYRRLTGATSAQVPGSLEVLRRAEAGDRTAAAVWDRGVDRLGELVAEMVRALGLRTVIVGGGLVRAGQALMEPLDGAVRRYLTLHPVPRLVPAALGSAAGTHGAALLAWEAARSVRAPLSSSGPGRAGDVGLDAAVGRTS
ncbi:MULTISPECIES: ROK family protein [unclassified Isoptericola]|uniref:ROK family protein n=1 Tax=unclassified Isoptericola TaxID=2623355 RepID=UPI002713C84D|nr:MULTISPECIES: ROK family protein [unclassified Isoptericola]MDO8145633.1 ROK family protein [Isoptericola sp. 178]MDO8149171.1 ROK family protein [Isoptericola sp. b515]